MNVEIRPLAALAECQEAYRLQVEIWGAEQSVPSNQIVVAMRIGGLALGAFAPDGAMSGFSLAVPALQSGAPYLWSDILAVRADWRGRGLGRRLKWAQREHALRLGFQRICWTYDPLQAVNAQLNIGTLGGTSRTYLPNLYGEMHDGLNGGLPTDRLLVDWSLDSPAVTRLAAGAAPPSIRAAALPTATQVEAGPLPRLVDVNLDLTAPALLCAIPSGFAAVRQADPGEALRWRSGVRQALVHYFDRGYAITGITAAGPGLIAYRLTTGIEG